MTSRADADGWPPLPHTFRPLWARRVVYPIAALVVATFGAAVVAVPGGAGAYHAADRAGIAAVGVLAAAVLLRIAGVHITATASGVRVVNILRSRRLEWAEIIAVRLEPAAPWLTLDLSDGTELAAMGVQGSDGAYAREQAVQLARLVVRYTPTDRDT
jgi:Bacterial PH domain